MFELLRTCNEIISCYNNRIIHLYFRKIFIVKCPDCAFILVKSGRGQSGVCSSKLEKRVKEAGNLWKHSVRCLFSVSSTCSELNSECCTVFMALWEM